MLLGRQDGQSGGVHRKVNHVSRTGCVSSEATASTSPSPATSTSSRTWSGWRDPPSRGPRGPRPATPTARSGVRRPRRRPAAVRRAAGAGRRGRGGPGVPRKSAVSGSAGRRHTSPITPCCTTRPSRITASRSATAKASSWSWVTISAVVPAAQDLAQVAGEPLAQAGVERESGSSSRIRRGPTASERQGDPLALAAGEGRGQAGAVPLQPDQRQQLLDALGVGRGAGAGRSRRCARR